uniref:Uncharacterized protein n=1 Tax=Oryza nivara TaxID=4536 RepID=A0A0E0HCR7_ORYNI
MGEAVAAVAAARARISGGDGHSGALIRLPPSLAPASSRRWRWRPSGRRWWWPGGGTRCGGDLPPLDLEGGHAAAAQRQEVVAVAAPSSQFFFDQALLSIL